MILCGMYHFIIYADFPLNLFLVFLWIPFCQIYTGESLILGFSCVVSFEEPTDPDRALELVKGRKFCPTSLGL